MVDAYFDDENEYERLIAMLNENTSVEVAERFVSLEIMHNDLEVANSNLKEAYSDLEGAESRIRELEAEVEDLKKQLNSKYI